MNVAFCINKLAMMGLGVTLSSIIRNCSDPNLLRIWILCADLTSGDKENIDRLLFKEKFDGVVQYLDFDPVAEFGDLRSLHGDWTTYGRLLLPDLVQEDNILYLDADIVVETDIIEYRKYLCIEQAIGAVHSGQLETTLENQFYIDILHHSPNAATFNAGILVMNLDRWRRNNIKEACLKVARKYPNELLSCDQTVLNAVFADNFAKLPQNLNAAWFADSSKPQFADKMIFHFVGSPKPWDPLASFIHNGYSIWIQYLTPEWKKAYGQINLAYIKRAWQIRRSYIRRLKKYLRSNS